MLVLLFPVIWITYDGISSVDKRPDNTLLMMKRVVGCKVQVLVRMCGLSIYRRFEGAILLSMEENIKAWNLIIF